jgi:tetratricopeptide (TPR) repeat protein
LLKLLARDTGNLTLRTAAIREACDVGCWDTARGLIDAGLLAHPAQAELLAFSGLIHLKALRYRDAEEAFSAAQAQGVNTQDMQYDLAYAQFMQKRYSDALARLLPVTGSSPAALLLRARCHHHLGRREEAIADCERHLTATADDADAHGLLALVLYEQNQRDRAHEHARQALGRNPQQLEAMLARACLLADSRQDEAARRAFDSLLEAYPRCGRAWLALALLELAQMHLEGAKRASELAAAQMPDHIGTWHVLAWIEVMLGNVPAANDALHRALAVDRNFGETHGGLAVIAALQGRDADARWCIRRALRLDQQSVAARYAELLLLQRAGRHEATKAALDAFLARPVSAGGLQYRDLVAAHLKNSVLH